MISLLINSLLIGNELSSPSSFQLLDAVIMGDRAYYRSLNFKLSTKNILAKLFLKYVNRLLHCLKIAQANKCTEFSKTK